MLADTPQWISDWGVVIGFLVGLCSLIAFFYAFTRFAVGVAVKALDRVLEERVPPMVDSALAPVKEKLEHLHDCVERVGSEAVETAGEARDAAQANASIIAAHVEQDTSSFQALQNWQDTVDVALSTIQDTQALRPTDDD